MRVSLSLKGQAGKKRLFGELGVCATLRAGWLGPGPSAIEENSRRVELGVVAHVLLHPAAQLGARGVVAVEHALERGDRGGAAARRARRSAGAAGPAADVAGNHADAALAAVVHRLVLYLSGRLTSGPERGKWGKVKSKQKTH